MGVRDNTSCMEEAALSTASFSEPRFPCLNIARSVLVRVVRIA